MVGIRMAALAVAFANLSSAALGQGKLDPKHVEFFETKIRPVLAEQCYACHSEGTKKLKAGLKLDTREGLRMGGDSGPALAPGEPEKSLLMRALRHEGPEMPPKGKLSPETIRDFETWIRLGAPDPRDGKAAPANAAIDWKKARTFWAFQAPRAVAPPAVKNAAWPTNDLDRFVLAEMEKRGLKPAPFATRMSWIRRATFDLLGLPPTPEEIDAFEKDDSPDAFARVVDRLLASPHYGERWGRWWLDLARYTDDLGGTVGPVDAPNAFRYRDWVVAAFNRDIPYDRFVRLQLAGDLIADPADDYAERFGGLGFQGLGQRFSGNAVGMAKKKVADELDDRVDTVTRSLLGLTVSCARCHDHKFDPIPTGDYYSLAAAYNGATLSTEIELASPQSVAAEALRKKTIAELQAKIENAAASEGRRVGREAAARVDEYLLAAWQLRVLADRKLASSAEAVAKKAGLHPHFLARWDRMLASALRPDAKPLPLLEAWQAIAKSSAAQARGEGGTVEIPPELREASAKIKTLAQEALHAEANKKKLSPSLETFLRVFLINDNCYFELRGKDVVPFLSAAQREDWERQQAELERLKKTAVPSFDKAPAVLGGGQPMRINVRGNAEELGAAASPGFLSILRKEDSPSTGSFTRLDLADAMVRRDNPLTARVWVNRVWHHHFGRGIVGTTSNFGELGERPSHPELLDTLAVRFMEQGWSTKKLHREIMLSSTYRLSSDPDAANAVKDADNRYLWRMSPRRLDFEAWRDAMLAAGGKLDPKVGGPPFFEKTTVQLHPEDPKNRRRTIYSFISRFKPNPTLTLFDVPEPNVTSDQRHATTIPQQQLFALNSPFTIAASQALAARVEKEAPDEALRLERVWRLAYGRPPSDQERRTASEFLRSAAASNEQPRPWERLCHALLTSNEFAFVN